MKYDPQFAENKTLAFIGDGNWDIYIDKDGEGLWAIPKPENTSCETTHFGNKNHIKRLIDKGYFNDEPTDAGLEYLSGLQSRLCSDPQGGTFSILSFQ